MVAAAPAVAVSNTAMTSVHKNTPVVTRPNDPPANLSRRPLTPSERDNAGFSRRPRTKEITSRYLSSYSSSSSSTTSTSYSSNTIISSSSPSFSSRRFPSPLSNNRPSTPSTFSQGLTSKRSQSVDRTRPSTPRPDPRGASATEGSNAARALCTTTRSLSVSFQGESFFFQTSKAKEGFTTPSRKPTPDRRRLTTMAGNSTAYTTDQSENSRARDHHHRWPAARSRKSSLLTKSLDCSAESNDILPTVQLLRQSLLFNGGSGRASFDGVELSASSDTDSVSSGSNSGVPELNVPRHARVTSRGISGPARFWQETNSRLRRLPEPGTPVSSIGSRNSATPKIVSARSSIGDSLSRSVSSPLTGTVRPSSPIKLAGSPSRGIASPLRVRGCSTLVSSLPAGLTANAPSIISFAAEVRRTKKGENRIEEAHMLRLFHNQHLQWRCVNARAIDSLMIQRVTVEKNLYNAWITILEARDLVTIKRIKLHFLTQYLKLTSILKGQMVYLEETSLLDREHSSSLSGAIESLKASTLRLPVVGGARADLQQVKDAVGSAVDVMQALGASMHSLMSKAEGRKSLVSELAKVAAQEKALLDQSRNLLSTVAALHIKACSLRGHLLQLKRRAKHIYS